VFLSSLFFIYIGMDTKWNFKSVNLAFTLSRLSSLRSTITFSDKTFTELLLTSFNSAKPVVIFLAQLVQLIPPT